MQNKDPKILNGGSSSPVTKGKTVEAIYLEPQLTEYENNPLILSLPRIMNTEEAVKRLAYFPEFDQSIKHQPDYIRHHKINNGLRFFSPLDIHLDIERRISCLIRAGYIERNPLDNTYYKKIHRGVDSISQYGDENEFFSTKYHGYNILGVSGVGKTQTVERILGHYPQVIRHSSFHGTRFTANQLVWLKLDCPFDGSTKGLCLTFFKEVDRIFQTNYLKNYGTKKTTDEMLPYMALVSSLHFLGVLVIDEIQRLNLAKSGGAEKMLNFFTQLVNTVGVPVVMVGTYKALPLFSGNVSQTRRGTGQGDLVWDRMAFNEQWEAFIESLWKYQCTRHEVSEAEKQKLSQVLYEETQGITDLTIKAFIFAQQRAIESGKEKITAGIIRSVVKDKFKLLLPALEALRNIDKRALELYEDIYPKFKGNFLARSPEIVGAASSLPEIKLELPESSENLTGEITAKSTDDSNIVAQDKSAAVSLNNLLAFKQNSKRQNKKNGHEPNNQKSALEQNVLGAMLVKNKNQPAYQIFLANGYIRSGSEFFEGGLK